MIDQELSALEIVGIAIRAERDAFDLYDSLARRVSNPDLVKEFESLAEQEKEHERWLTDYYKEATGLDEAPPVPDVKIKIFGPDVHDGMSVVQVLEVAVEKEHVAERVYAEAARRARDASGRRLLERLVEFERGHARRLQEQLDHARRDPSWLEDAGGRTIQLEGP
jgi:rubrerythrin